MCVLCLCLGALFGNGCYTISSEDNSQLEVKPLFGWCTIYTSLQDGVEEVATASDGNKEDLFTSVISVVPQDDHVWDKHLVVCYANNLSSSSSCQEPVKPTVKPLGESSGGTQPTAGSTPAHVLTPKEVSNCCIVRCCVCVSGGPLCICITHPLLRLK